MTNDASVGWPQFPLRGMHSHHPAMLKLIYYKLVQKWYWLHDNVFNRVSFVMLQTNQHLSFPSITNNLNNLYHYCVRVILKNLYSKVKHTPFHHN